MIILEQEKSFVMVKQDDHAHIAGEIAKEL